MVQNTTHKHKKEKKNIGYIMPFYFSWGRITILVLVKIKRGNVEKYLNISITLKV